MAQLNREQDPYERARRDPGFRAAVEAAHRGRWAVPDALWWAEHPLETSPGGTAAPALRLRALQRRVFGLGGDAAGDQDAARALRELELEILTERAALAAAVTTAASEASDTATGAATTAAPTEPQPPEQHPPDGPDGPVGLDGLDGPNGPDGPDGLDGPNGPDGPDDRDDRDDRQLGPGARLFGSSRGRWALASGLTVAVLLGVIVGSQLSVATGSGASESTPTPTPTATAARELPAAAVFSRPQLPEDIPQVPLPGVFAAAEFRYLDSAGFEDGDGDGVVDSPFYAARGYAGMFCLVAVPSGSGYLATCTHEAEFPPAGLRLTWQSTDGLPNQADGGGVEVLAVTAVWFRSGSAEAQFDLLLTG